MLRSRSKTSPAAQSKTVQHNKSKPTSALKKYGTVMVQLFIFLVLLYALWLSIGSKTMDNAMDDPLDDIDKPLDNVAIEEAIAQELQIVMESPDDNASDDEEEDKSIQNKEDSNGSSGFWSQDDCDWRPDNLVGTCFGLTFIKSIESAAQCKEACCKDEECITWQYHPTKGCQNGGNVRLGMEHAATPNWCEPTKPKPWKGRRIKGRNNDNVCEWEAEELNTQCFGLGSERKEIKSVEECAKLCCYNQEKECDLYQWRDDKGCFIGKSRNCDSDTLSYIGQRKMVFDNNADV